LFSLLVDERVRLDDNRKEQVMKALFKKIRQHVEKKKERSMHSKQTKYEKELCTNKEIVFGCIFKNKVFLDIENQS
jgi:hypothetical protein